jgi:hypothetical protein
MERDRPSTEKTGVLTVVEIVLQRGQGLQDEGIDETLMWDSMLNLYLEYVQNIMTGPLPALVVVAAATVARCCGCPRRFEEWS